MNEQICHRDRGQSTWSLHSVFCLPVSLVIYCLFCLSPFLPLGTMKWNSLYMSNVKIHTKEGFWRPFFIHIERKSEGWGEPSHTFRWVSGTQSEQAWFPSQTQFGPLWDAIATRLWFLVKYVHSKGCNYRMQTALLMSSQDNSSAQSQCRFSLKTPRKEVSEQYWKWTTGSSRDCLSYFESFFFCREKFSLKG